MISLPSACWWKYYTNIAFTVRSVNDTVPSACWWKYYTSIAFTVRSVNTDYMTDILTQGTVNGHDLFVL